MEHFFLALFSLPPGQIFYRIMFWYFGWLPLAIMYLIGSALLWRRYRRIKWFQKQEFVLLAIDIPENNEQSCRAVENLFIYLAGAHKTINLIEEWWEGVFQLSFSLEIVGIDGYIQYLVRTPVNFKPLVESAIYSIYPDAEIAEVEDYTKNIPTQYPNEEYDVWGAEFIPSQNHMLPIRLYKDFEHQFGPPETTYRDPLASLMDLLSSLQRGEQLWYQIILIPTGFDWVKEGEELIKKIAGIKSPPRQGLFGKAMNQVGKVAGEMSYIVAAGIDPSKEHTPATESEKPEVSEFNSMKLTPQQKKQVEAIQEKVSKMGFEVKIRMVYVGEKDVINKPKVVNGFVGFIKQFTANDLNGLRPDMKLTATSAAYFRAKSRMNIKKGKIVRAFKDRDDVAGRKPFIMNAEELATLWHFPIDAVVKAPLIQRAAARRIEAPMDLPSGEQQVDLDAAESIFADDYKIEEEEENNSGITPLENGQQGQAPDNLPFV